MFQIGGDVYMGKDLSNLTAKEQLEQLKRIAVEIIPENDFLKKVEKSIKGKKQTRVIGVETTIEVYKSSVWKPYRTAPLYIVFDYGIDDIRSNLQYLKSTTGSSTYELHGERLGQSMEDAISTIEKHDLESSLKESVIDLWEEVEATFVVERKPKRR